MSQPVAELEGIHKAFGDTWALKGVDLALKEGEFFSLLGASGCGKTTLLRILSGLEFPTRGTVKLDGRDVAHVPANRRDTHQVFQSYALFPHMNVEENVGYGLRVRGVAASEQRQRVRDVLELVALTDLVRRMPAQLSGGQRQRVALARALVCRPRVLLLDEPLSALDTELRRTMRAELRRLQRSLGTTFVLVTHDQEEALALSDRLAVMREGKVEALGEATAVYDRPRTRYVASFLGAANVLPIELLDAGRARFLGVVLPLAHGRGPGSANAALRREQLTLGGPQDGVPAIVEEVVFHGATADVSLKCSSGERVVAIVAGRAAPQPRETVHLHFSPEDVIVLDD